MITRYTGSITITKRDWVLILCFSGSVSIISIRYVFCQSVGELQTSLLALGRVARSSYQELHWTLFAAVVLH